MHVLCLTVLARCRYAHDMTTEASINTQDAVEVCDLLDRAAQVLRVCSLRKGSRVHLPDTGRLLVSGDIHDHSENLAKIIKLAKLDAGEDRHLILQELIHGDRLFNGMDFSYRMALVAAELVVRYPDRVHILLSNHELAQVNGDSIIKAGVSGVDAFNEGMSYVFGEQEPMVAESLHKFVRAMPLAVQCANGVFCSHSLPSPSRLKVFDPEVLDRVPSDDDMHGPEGSAYLLVWGRSMQQAVADKLAEQWGTEVFVVGHQPADYGFEAIDDSILVINSDDQAGRALPIDLSKKYTRDKLVDRIVTLSGVV